MIVGRSLFSTALTVTITATGALVALIPVSNANPTESLTPSPASALIENKTAAPGSPPSIVLPSPSPALSPSPASAPTAPGAIANPQPAAVVTPPEAPAKKVATHLVLDLTQRKVTAYKDKEVLAIFPVAVGKKGWETPKGNFKVIQMTKNPTWQNPWNGKVMPAGPNSALGERWIGFWTNGKDTIGFHGTPTVSSIGKAASHGCVRMYNKDVKALFEIVSIGTPVTVK